MAEQEVKFDVDFSPFSDYEPYSGDGGADFIDEDGTFQVKITGCKAYMSKARDGKEPAPMLRVNCVIEDDDKYAGRRLISNVHCGGKDKNGDSMARQLMALLLSSGTPLENIHKNGKSGTKSGIDAIIKTLTGRTAWCEVVADTTPKGQETSRIDNWLEDKPQERYLAVKTNGAHRRKRRTVGTAPGQAVAGFNLGGAAAVPAPNGATLPASGTNPML